MRTSLIAIAVSFLLFSNLAHAGGWLNRSISRLRGEQTFGVGQDRRAAANETHGGSGVCDDCGPDSMRSRFIGNLPVDSPLSAGVDRTLVNLFRSCDAADPLTDIVTHSAGQTRLTYDQNRRNFFLNVTPGTANAGVDTVRDVMNREVEGRTYEGGPEVVQNGPYARHVANAQCPDPVVSGRTIDSERNPVIFQNGSTLAYSPGQGLNPYSCATNPQGGYCNLGPRSQPAIALDCMEFVTTAMASACLKFTEDDNFTDGRARFLPGPRYVSNRAVASTLGDSNSCFDRIGMNNPNFIQEGDLIFGSESPNHAVILTDVDPSDPFGIIAHGSRSCDSLTPRNFRFSLAQSTSEASLGPSKVAASDYFCFYNREQLAGANIPCGGPTQYAVPFPLNDLLVRAKQICEARKRSQAPPPASINPNYHFVRHNGSSECRMSEDECPNVIGDECADDVCRLGRGS